MDIKQVIKYGREGYWKHYYPNGNIFSEGLYINGRKEGIWKEYHSNNDLYSIGTYKNNNQIGYWKMYHRNNIIKYIEYFVV